MFRSQVLFLLFSPHIQFHFPSIVERPFLGRVRRRNHLSYGALGDLAGIGGAIARWERFRHNPFASDSELSALGNLFLRIIISKNLIAHIFV